MQHRIFVVPLRSDRTVADARRHWHETHRELFGATPGLTRYRQNRPVPEDPAEATRLVCSETWFDSRRTEQQAFRSEHYRAVVTPDEQRFLDRDAAWSARVVEQAPVSRSDSGPYRVLWFGEQPVDDPGNGQWSSVRVDREVIGPGTGTLIRCGVFTDLGAAHRAARGPVLTLVCEPIDMTTGESV